MVKCYIYHNLTIYITLKQNLNIKTFVVVVVENEMIEIDCLSYIMVLANFQLYF